MSRKIKRIVALLGVIILVGLYLATLILAFVDPTEAKNWLKAARRMHCHHPSILLRLSAHLPEPEEVAPGPFFSSSTVSKR